MENSKSNKIIISEQSKHRAPQDIIRIRHCAVNLAPIQYGYPQNKRLTINNDEINLVKGNSVKNVLLESIESSTLVADKWIFEQGLQTDELT